MIMFLGEWRISPQNDPAGWAKRYLEVHVPAVRALPELLRHTVGHAVADDGSELWNAQLWFADHDARARADASEEMKTVIGTGVMKDAEDLTMSTFEIDDWHAGLASGAELA
jgi:hypothetical protein